MDERLLQYRKEMEAELDSILRYWAKKAPDERHGGFVGRIDENERADETAPRGSVLNGRILWSFSAAARQTGTPLYRQLADRSYEYFLQHFIDPVYGGVYWTVDQLGRPLDTRKQIYALAFAVYGLSEYCHTTGSEAARQAAIAIYRSILAHSHDRVHGGFLEALAQDWQPLDDLRLSAKDANEKKSMNTHLHVLEGFASLYRVWPDQGLYEHIRSLLRIFIDHVIDPATHHLALFFDEQWQVKGDGVSYGHDIEASWLLLEAAEIIGDASLVTELGPLSLKMADAASRGLDEDGGLWYELEPAAGRLVREKHWWPQAEAMVGYFNAWQLSGDERYLRRSLAAWDFVKRHLLDRLHGEWFWGVTEGYRVMPGQDKAGLWKCPYHNSRACMEIIRRVNESLESRR